MNETLQSLSKQRLRLWLRILRAQRIMEARIREDLRTGFDSTLPRFDVLSALDRHREGLRMTDLSTMLKVSNGNITGIVDRLALDGLVERISVDGDRRAMRVRLTPRGTQRFARMAGEHETWVDAMLSNLDAGELQTLIDLLSRIGEDET